MSEAVQTKLITENGYDKWILNTFYFFLFILNERIIIHLRHDVIFFCVIQPFHDPVSENFPLIFYISKFLDCFDTGNKMEEMTVFPDFKLKMK